MLAPSFLGPQDMPNSITSMKCVPPLKIKPAVMVMTPMLRKHMGHKPVALAFRGVAHQHNPYRTKHLLLPNMFSIALGAPRALRPAQFAK